MIERDMEDLIAAYSGDFFPRFQLTLVGRQQSFEGVGRFDLLFVDQHQTTILMELKAKPAKYENADQLAKYKDELERRGHRRILMWLVAPLISQSIREFLDSIGIEHTEIHVAEFRRVAERHGVVIKGDAAQNVAANPTATQPKAADRGARPSNRIGVARISPVTFVETGPIVTQPSSFAWGAFGYDLTLSNPTAFDFKRFSSLVDGFEAASKKKSMSLVADLRAWASDPARNRWPHECNRSLLRWTITPGATYKAAVPFAEAIWVYLFGKPAPTWYWWERTEGYKFDPHAWKVWFDSLCSVPSHVQKTYFEHNHESARSWPAEKQCQCADCQQYLAYEHSRKVVG